MTSRDLVNIATGATRFAHKQILAQLENSRITGVGSADAPANHDTKPRKRKPLKVGHAGTLDPLAHGVLVLGIGTASRLVPCLQRTSKAYRASFRLGFETDSGDLEEKPTPRPDLPIPSPADIEAAAKNFIGSVRQIPPAHSAIKIDGMAAYKLVREGKSVDVPSREVVVHELSIIDYAFPNLELEIVCGSGTYIRTLGMDLAAAVGNCAVMTSLVRTRVGSFFVEQSFHEPDIRQRAFVDALISPADGLAHMPRINLNADQTWRIDHGLTIPTDDVLLHTPDQKSAVDPYAINEPDEAIAVDASGRLRAIVTVKNGEWRPHPVFHDDD